MGYTHYLPGAGRRQISYTTAQFEAAAKHCAQILAGLVSRNALPEMEAPADGRERDILNAVRAGNAENIAEAFRRAGGIHVWFKGAEPFRIPMSDDGRSRYCKTFAESADTAIVALSIAVQRGMATVQEEGFVGLKFDSDGSPEMLRAGFDLYRQITGEPAEIKFHDEYSSLHHDELERIAGEGLIRFAGQAHSPDEPDEAQSPSM